MPCLRLLRSERKNIRDFTRQKATWVTARNWAPVLISNTLCRDVPCKRIPKSVQSTVLCMKPYKSFKGTIQFNKLIPNLAFILVFLQNRNCNIKTLWNATEELAQPLVWPIHTTCFAELNLCLKASPLAAGQISGFSCSLVRICPGCCWDTSAHPHKAAPSHSPVFARLRVFPLLTGEKH